ncbi:MAG: hypothetical protein R2838_12580 [Caldilineaceae bacterium]
MYETSLRIPLIWSGRDYPPGTPSHVMSTIMTPSGRCRIGRRRHSTCPPPIPDGATHRCCRGDSSSWDDTRFGEYGDLRMIRTPTWKLVWRFPAGPHDLFNLAADPGETVNLAADPAHAARLADLKAALDQFFATHDTPGKIGPKM